MIHFHPLVVLLVVLDIHFLPLPEHTLEFLDLFL